MESIYGKIAYAYQKKQQIVGKNKPYMDGMGLLMEITSCQLGC